MIEYMCQSKKRSQGQSRIKEQHSEKTVKKRKLEEWVIKDEGCHETKSQRNVKLDLQV